MRKKNLRQLMLTTLGILFMSAAVLTGCKDKKDTKTAESSSASQADIMEEATKTPTPEPTKAESTPTEKPTEAPTETPTPEETAYRNELTGEALDEKYENMRPVAVMYNNIKDGLPHYGVGEADIVYEAYVEGGITRLLAIFKKYDTLEAVGSIRSTRSYYVSFAREYNAVLSHFGGPHKYVDKDLAKIDRFDGQLVSDVYYQFPGRYAPHNAFGSGEGFLKGFEKYGISKTYTDEYKGAHFKFAEEGEAVELEDGITANKVVPGYVYNKPYLIYNKDTGLYEKYQFEEADLDGNTNEQLTYKNIIIQYADGETLDGSPYLRYDLVDDTKTGWYITNGKAIEITWKKAGENEITKYYDKDGNEIVLNVGKTYIFLFPAGIKTMTTIE